MRLRNTHLNMALKDGELDWATRLRQEPVETYPAADGYLTVNTGSEVVTHAVVFNSQASFLCDYSSYNLPSADRFVEDQEGEHSARGTQSRRHIRSGMPQENASLP